MLQQLLLLRSTKPQSVSCSPIHPVWFASVASSSSSSQQRPLFSLSRAAAAVPTGAAFLRACPAAHTSRRKAILSQEVTAVIARTSAARAGSNFSATTTTTSYLPFGCHSFLLIHSNSSSRTHNSSSTMAPPVSIPTSSPARNPSPDAPQANGADTSLAAEAATPKGKAAVGKTAAGRNGTRAAPAAGEGEGNAVAGEGKGEEGGSRTRRDRLLAIEKQVNAELWCKDGKTPYEVEAPPAASVASEQQQDGQQQQQQQQQKYFCSFPYPYMNGKLHLGHAFTLCRAEFQARYQRMQGKRILWPFGLHCTGMPILACADKLKREVTEQQQQQQQIGVCSTEEEDDEGSKRQTSLEARVDEQGSGSRNDNRAPEEEEKKKKKSKVAAKSGNALTQWQIMRNMGIPETEIAQFTDASHWLRYFPPLAIRDLKALGVAVDWRRSFITTDMNPYYDAFVRWQFNTLLKRNKLKYGMRATIFGRRERQACADHDRASGESVVPQEYTLIKLTLQQEQFKQQLQERRQLLQQEEKQQENQQRQETRKDGKEEGEEGEAGREERERRKISKQEEFLRIAEGKQVLLLAATLRPETIYGITNCFVLPEGQYVAPPAPAAVPAATEED